MTPAFEFAPGLTIQGFQAPLALSQFKLIAFDMDSTLINIECVDEIADAVGKKAEVAAITEAAMRGEIADYKESLRLRVALLRGVTEADMQRVYDERLRLNPGEIGRLVDHLHQRAFTLFESDIETHRIEDEQDVREEDSGVHAIAAHGLERGFGSEGRCVAEV